MHLLVGDIQGCADALDRLLAEAGFSPSRDQLFVLGDLVNRGPDSLGVLRRLRDLGSAASCVLGNHDWHLLAAAAGVRPLHRSDTLDDILDAPDREAWLDWVRNRPMAVHAHGWLMVHAGVVPQWDLAATLALAADLERALRDSPPREFLAAMFGNEPLSWRESLRGAARLRFTLNALTRIRFVTTDGTLELETKDGADAAPAGYHAWFDAPGRRTASLPIAFGHWSTLGLLDRPDVLGLDTGCVWGGKLSAARIDGGRREIVQVACSAAQRPGKKKAHPEGAAARNPNVTDRG